MSDRSTDIYRFPTHARYHEKRCTGYEWPCFVCGKPVTNQRYMVRTWEGAAICTDAIADANPASDSGGYPIGPECYRKLPVEVRKTMVVRVKN